MADEGKHRGTPRDVMFLHHSTGKNIIYFDDADAGGDVRARLAARDIDFWDHDYPGDESIHRPDGSAAPDYGIANTDPDGFYDLFCQDENGDFSQLLAHGTILFKSCYPTCHIDSDEKLEQYEKWYVAIGDIIEKHPDKLFMPFTPPPLHALATNSDEAARSRAFAEWMVGEWQAGHNGRVDNMRVFNLFDILAGENLSGPESNMLRPEYRRDPENKDSHPNDAANKVASAALVDFIESSVKGFESKGWRGGKK